MWIPMTDEDTKNYSKKKTISYLMFGAILVFMLFVLSELIGGACGDPDGQGSPLGPLSFEEIYYNLPVYIFAAIFFGFPIGFLFRITYGKKLLCPKCDKFYSVRGQQLCGCGEGLQDSDKFKWVE